MQTTQYKQVSSQYNVFQGPGDIAWCLQLSISPSEDPGFTFQHPQANHNRLLTTVPEDLMPSSGLHEHCMHVVHKDTIIHLNKSLKSFVSK